MDDKKKLTVLDAINLARKGVSPRSIAAKAGMSLDVFLATIKVDPEIEAAFNNAVADFEIENADVRYGLLLDDETHGSLKAKIAGENLKTLEHWATASKAVRVIHSGDQGMTFPDMTYEDISNEDFDRIKAETEAKAAREREADGE